MTAATKTSVRSAVSYKSMRPTMPVSPAKKQSRSFLDILLKALSPFAS